MNLVFFKGRRILLAHMVNQHNLAFVMQNITPAIKIYFIRNALNPVFPLYTVNLDASAD